MTDEADSPKVGRRGMSLAVVAGGCAMAAGVGVPVAVFVAAPVSGGAVGGRWVKTVRLDQLKEREAPGR